MGAEILRPRHSSRSGSSRRSRSSKSAAPLPPAPPVIAWPSSEWWLALAAGFVFAAGLVLGGMTDPVRVIAFLDVKEMFEGPFPGRWDPTLGLVMAGALAVSLVAFSLTPYASRQPWVTREFRLPEPGSIDTRLIAGAVLFGIGWGIAGFCPGPALASLFTGRIEPVIFVMSMLPGMYLAGKI